MKMVPIKQAKDQLSDLVRGAERGETVVITRNGEPVADLVPHVKTTGLDFEALRKWQEARGLSGPVITWVADDFDDELPWDFLFSDRP